MKQNIRIDLGTPAVNALDFSHLLDAPAGKHGFVRSRSGHLYFEDGTRARFLGFNISARSNTPDHETAEIIAGRLASLGVNFVRMHAADAPISDEPATWSSCRTAPLLDYDSGSSRKFHPVGLDRFDYLFAQFKKRGIYIHFDLLIAREFIDGDDLDYPGIFASTLKRYPMYNERLIELQKEYAREFLTHVNPYTGLAYADDPAIVTVQMNNEESAIKGDMGADMTEQMKPYRDEVQKRFNHFLLAKYQTRDRLAKAWTYEGVCALKENEDPENGTVEAVMGNFHQPVNDPEGDWNGECSPARYSDFMEFGIQMNHRFYQDMKNYLISLGVKVPIAASNLVAGAADIYGHTVGDVMENNSYFNHPMMPVNDGNYMVVGPTELVSTNPLTIQRGVGAMATTLINFASLAAVEGKPLIITEWNEYGLHPFHSTAFVQMVAYACLNDWDGLLLYNHHTSETLEAEPADEIHSIFDAYNDPALISQWGFMASVFYKGLVSGSTHTTDIVYTKNDLLTLPQYHAMPSTFFPYITSMRSVFLDGDEIYRGNADVALTAGFLNGGDLSGAKHSVYYAWSSNRDAMRKYRDGNRMKALAENGEEVAAGVTLNDQALVFENIRETAGTGDYRKAAELFTQAMRKWGVLPEGAGYEQGRLVSDTKEICFDPDNARFEIQTDGCAYFSGAPEETIELGKEVSVHAKNERISISLMPESGRSLKEAKSFLVSAVGATGTDQASYNPGPELMPGLQFTIVRLDGKLYAETMEGTIRIKADQAVLQYLDPIGNVLKEEAGTKNGEDSVFVLDGTVPSVNYRIVRA